MSFPHDKGYYCYCCCFQRPPIWSVAANKLNKQSWTADKGWPSSLGVGRGANYPSLQNSPVKKHLHAGCFLWRQNSPEVNYSPTRISGWVFLGEASRRIQREVKLGTWNFRSLYRAGFLKAAARELARYKLDVVGVQEVSWDKGGAELAGDYNFFYGKGNENHQLGTVFLYTVE